MSAQRTEEHLIAVNLGDSYRRLNQLARRLSNPRHLATQEEKDEVAALRLRIAALKRGERIPTQRDESQDGAA